MLPFSHLFGLVVSGLAPLLAGGRVTTMERFNPLRAARDHRECGHHAARRRAGGVRGACCRRSSGAAASAPTSLRVCICGGAPLPLAIQERWAEATGVELRQGYGLTEAGPVCLFNDVHRPNRRGTMGVPLPGVQVDDPRGATPGRPSRWSPRARSACAGHNVSPGYLGVDSAATGEPWAGGLGRHGAWLRTGDLGVQHADGTITFRGLCKPMFTRNGFNIYPRELERVVGAMPGVRAVTVRAVPEPVREHDIALDVTPVSPAATLSTT